MCGRYTVSASAADLEKQFNAQMGFKEWKPRFNASPSQILPVIFSSYPQTISPAIWGFVPAWQTNQEPGSGIINARDDSLTTKPTFKKSFQERRCLVLADGFFEWSKTPGGKLPYWIGKKDRKPFAMAGIWRLAGTIPTFAIVTTVPTLLVSKIHNRMPVILEPSNHKTWLNGKSDQAQQLLLPYPSENLQAHAVSTQVNYTRNDFPSLLDPLPY